MKTMLLCSRCQKLCSCIHIMGDYYQKPGPYDLNYYSETVRMIKERRSTSRFDSNNLISYVYFDKNNHKSGQGMGRTLNISENGIMLETHVPIDPDGSMSLTIGLEEEVMDINGKITFSNKKECGKYETGVHFNKPDEEKRRFLRHYITLFREQEFETGAKG